VLYKCQKTIFERTRQCWRVSHILQNELKCAKYHIWISFTYCFELLILWNRRPTIQWQWATPVIVGWFAGRTWETNNKWICFNYQINVQFLYSITIHMLRYNPRHISSSTMLIFRRSNCIFTASGIVTVCKRPYSTPIETRVCSQLAYCTAV